MAEAEETQDAAKMPRHQRYYALHREEKLAKYHTNPEIIAKRQEREQKKIEKEAEKEVIEAEAEVLTSSTLSVVVLSFSTLLLSGLMSVRFAVLGSFTMQAYSISI